MATSQTAKVQVELGRNMVDFAVMTDSGDHRTFTLSGATLWSGRSGYEPDIRPNGIVTGLNLLSTHATNDTVTIAGFTAYSKGVLQTVSATSLALTRPSTDTHKICSVTMDEDGTIAEVEGTEGTSFSTTRGAAGGPPLIPIDSVEIGQVKFSAQAAAAIDADEIFQDANDHAEFTDYPIADAWNIGKGSNAAVAAEKNAHIKLNVAVPLAHTGGVAKRIYTKYYSPNMTTLAKVVDFAPAEVGVSKSSESMYEGSGVSGAIGAMKADSIGDASFVFFAGDGVTDAIVRERNQVVTVKFFPNANKAPYMLTQGMLGFNRSFPAGEQNKISVTVYCEKESVEFSS